MKRKQWTYPQHRRQPNTQKKEIKSQEFVEKKRELVKNIKVIENLINEIVVENSQNLWKGIVMHTQEAFRNQIDLPVKNLSMTWVEMLIKAKNNMNIIRKGHLHTYQQAYQDNTIFLISNTECHKSPERLIF